MKATSATLLIALLAFCSTCTLKAQSPAALMTAPGSTYAGGSYTLGFSFSLSMAVQVTALGVYDDGQDGLADAAQVGIWDSNGQLLVSNVVSAGTGGTLNGYYRYANITPFSLSPNTTYVVGAYINDTASSFNTNQGGSGSYASVVIPGTDRYVNSGGFAYPSVDNGNAGGNWAGGNFQFAVPEPSTWVMLGLGVAGLGVTILRRRTARA